MKMIKANYTKVNFCQVCRGCKRYYRNFKLDIDRYYDKNGKSCVKTEELFEKFSFICPICNLLNILNFNQICNEETVFFLRKRAAAIEKSNLQQFTYILK